MQTPFHTVGLVGKYDNPGMHDSVCRLGEFLRGRGHEVMLASQTAERLNIQDCPHRNLHDLATESDVVVVMGGDGTMLSIARELASTGAPLIGINQGRLGFLTDIPLANMEETLAAMLAGRHVEQRRTLLDVDVVRAAGGGERLLALNDVVVNRGSLGSMIECAVDIDARFGYAMRADGIIVATPTGSTAYALSAGGPILTPQLPAFLLVPVAPHALTHRPIAIGDDAEIVITVIRGRDAGVHCDGQNHFALAEGDCVRLKRAAFHARFLYPEGHDYFAMLREKLHWSATPERITRPPAG